VNRHLARSGAAILAACTYFACAWMSYTSAKAANHHRNVAIHKTAHARHETHHAQTGQASVYNSRLAGRKMASGEKFNPNSDSAASRTLPIGTVAAVTNLQNGRTTTVRIRDHGPDHRAGRIVDLSPKSAKMLGITKHGTGHVAIVPIIRPRPAAPKHKSIASR